MARQKALGKVETIQKVWLSMSEAAAYLGVSTRYLRDNIDPIPEVEIYSLGGNKKFYRLDNLDRVIRRGKVKGTG